MTCAFLKDRHVFKITIKITVSLAAQCSVQGSSPVKSAPEAPCPAASRRGRLCVRPDRDDGARCRAGLRGEHPSRPPLGLRAPRPHPPPAADSRPCGRVPAALPRRAAAAVRRPSGWAAGWGPGRGLEGRAGGRRPGHAAPSLGGRAFVRRRSRLSRRVFARLEARPPSSRGARPCPSPPSAASGKRTGAGGGDPAGARVQPGPSRAARPTSAPALGGPVSGPRGRQSGRRAPIGRPAGGGGAQPGLPGGRCRRRFQEDLDAFSSARDGQSRNLMNNQRSSKSRFSN